MKARILLFARYRELAGERVVEVEVETGATLAEVWRAVGRRVPALAVESRPLLAVDRAYAKPDRSIDGTEEIAAFPPVSGG